MPKTGETCIFKCYNMSVLTHGAETRIWINADISRLTEAEMSLLRSIEGRNREEKMRNKKLERI
jgi:hypothetical protein